MATSQTDRVDPLHLQERQVMDLCFFGSLSLLMWSPYIRFQATNHRSRVATLNSGPKLLPRGGRHSTKTARNTLGAKVELWEAEESGRPEEKLSSSSTDKCRIIFRFIRWQRQLLVFWVLSTQRWRQYVPHPTPGVTTQMAKIDTDQCVIYSVEIHWRSTMSKISRQVVMTVEVGRLMSTVFKWNFSSVVISY
jgi:hypothetical protein